VLLQQFDQQFKKFGLGGSSDRFYGDSYRRSTEHHEQQIISIVTYDRAEGLELDAPFISVRLDQVEELIAEFEPRSPLIESKDIAQRATIGFRLEPEGLLGIFRKSWMLNSEQDAVKAADQFVPHVMKHAIPYWQKFSDPAEVLKLLVEATQSSRVFLGTPAMISKRAIALGLILGGAEKAREIADLKLSTVKGAAAKREVVEWIERVFTARSPQTSTDLPKST